MALTAKQVNELHNRMNDTVPEETVKALERLMDVCGVPLFSAFAELFNLLAREGVPESDIILAYKESVRCQAMLVAATKAVQS